MLKMQLLEKVASREIVVGIVGLGYVGLPLAVSFAQAGIRVVGVDLDQQKIAHLQNGHSYIEDVSDAQIAPLIANGLLVVSADYASFANVDAVCICVPTPLKKNLDPDLKYVHLAGVGLAPYIRGKLISLESTIHPGGTDEVLSPLFSAEGAIVGQDYFLTFSPERIDPGRTDFTVETTPKVIGGATPACLEVGCAVYGLIIQHLVPVSGLMTAELVKLLENTFRLVNIGLVNELALMCNLLKVDVWEVVEAAATKPYGFMKFTPGPGIGGHCIPIDPHYLSWTMRGLKYTPRYIDLSAEINAQMPHHVVHKVGDALNDSAKSIRGSRIRVLGVAYKPNIGDMRESPALEIIELLRAKGATVAYNDPFVPDLSHEKIDLQSQELTADWLNSADCVVITTNHTAYDWAFVTAHAQLIVDTRHAIRNAGQARVVGL